MFVETMTSQQIVEQYSKDFAQITGRLEYDKNKWWRASLRHRTFPFVFAKSGMTKHNNLFKAIIYQEKKGKDFSKRILLRMKTKNGDAWIDGSSSMSGRKVLGINGSLCTEYFMFMPHLFRRYEERFGRMSGYDSISDQFFIRNLWFLSAGLYGTDRYGDNEVIGVISDGFIYGTVDKNDMFVIWRTYLHKDQLNNKQIDLMKYLLEDYLYNEDRYQGVDAKEYYFRRNKVFKTKEQ